MGDVHTNGKTEHCNGSSKTNGTVMKNGFAGDAALRSSRPSLWFEEEIEEDLRWVFSVSKILHTGLSKFQNIALVDSGPFGKVLILDGKLQSAEADEFVYHEALVHPALIHHSNPKNVFIMGGGEGSTARETLRHKSVQNVVMCDIDKEVVDFCRAYLTSNREAFRSNRLDLIINDASRAELEKQKDTFDVIIGDLADPVEGGPCYQLYTQSFYEKIVKQRLNSGGIFVTQAGPAGILSHGEIYTSIYNTLRQVFKFVVPYAAHVPSFSDTWGWIMASDQPLCKLSVEETDSRLKQRLTGDLRFLDGETMTAIFGLNKTVRRTLAGETHVYTEETARYIHGHGSAQTLSR
ncbi:hypothetical protein O6H91_09G083100 [Diphasiastrum complanatum]|uniref:Uncharacterized protein n=1 Tax=Diphasiastrum complanatum TaxID=34168 RepID=A0ACC2CRH1_DIPCM|nr:hypothetical protein O6H91_09G083100 [Diphasiastrum complanatum]